tara:strand:+ start:170 stop:1516 length:1347 start_codon:yes stop_codon:yes gene_type:complete
MDNNNKIITEELKQIVVLMNYDRSKTLMEQGDAKFDMYQRQRNAEHLGISYDEARRLESPSLEDFEWDHGTSAWVEIGLTVGGVILTLFPPTTAVGVGMIAAGTTIGIADAMVYYSEGDPYMGTMMLALQVIPGGELVGLFKNSAKVVKASSSVTKFVEKATPQQLTNIIELGSKGGNKLNDFQKKVYKYLVEGIASSTPAIMKKVSAKTIALMKSTMIGAGLIKSLPFMMKTGKWVGSTILKVGGVAVTVDQLWTLHSIPKDWWDKMRTKAEFSQIMDMLYSGELTDLMKDGLWILWQRIINGEDLAEDVSENIDYNEIEAGVTDMSKTTVDTEIEYLKNIKDKTIQDLVKINKNLKPVSISTIIDGKQLIKKGAKGKVVRNIQTMLVSLGYDLGNTGKGKDGIDGEYGDNMEAALFEFQIDNDLEDFDGIIGKETMTILKKLYDEK